MEIAGGLKAGEVVVVTGQQNLSEGAKVSVVRVPEENNKPGVKAGGEEK
jgi:hypothetical protein